MKQPTQKAPVVIIGGGPAGLTAAYELSKHELNSVVLEMGDRVGGISRTETYKGYRFDIGGHRFFTKVEEVQSVWKEVLADDFIQTPRVSRIYYDKKFYDYPLNIAKTLANLGPYRSAMIMASYLKAKAKKFLNLTPKIETFEQWVIHCFGSRLYRTFFKTYTEKVWGIPCNQIRSDWAAQRIQNMSLKAAVKNALFGSQNAKSLIKTFDYPRLGPGMMWERCQEILEQRGSPVYLDTEVLRIKHNDGHVTSVVAKRLGEVFELQGDDFINSMPIALLVHRLEPLPPAEVLEAAMGLKYRDFLIVTLILDKENLFPDNWLYIHSPEFQVGRIQNFKNWSPWMVPDKRKTCLGMEYFCSQGDDLWELSDDQLIELASLELSELGFGARQTDIKDGCVIRQLKAYPVYDGEYKDHLGVLEEYIKSFKNLQTVGRNGMHRYNNQDHSMLTALLAARNIVGEKHDIWNVNVERSYHENFTDEEWSKRQKPEVIATGTQVVHSVGSLIDEQRVEKRTKE